MRVRARDFLSWAEFDRELGKGVTLIRGFNYDDGTEEGCGKSAVPNIMSWCIFGEIPKEALVDDVIRESCKGCETEIYLEEFSVFQIPQSKRPPHQIRKRQDLPRQRCPRDSEEDH